ncbi:EVE domain-containing protein [Desulfovibrio litoralis]|uniref:Predicted RNA-binding protein, contains PUA-like domain n=1 Tax=Desulfovibrio litoralis DSM 11393 TaxID=1121455 RepID=A0A1M7T1P0_9BACT|nr:EVE domain-containing protein [Desulfovibrio litoralis]SHN64601.1 Predicted RNA-binding protein, contains PUA-like domain [Desulfovibrio litoralis DSM 11393]
MLQYWLVKSEANCYSIDDLIKEPNQTTAWSGVRNYQARNFMRDMMKIGDQVFFYHSVTNPGIVGLAEVCSKAYPDPTQWDMNDPHCDPKSQPDNPRWYLVDLKFVDKFKTPISLSILRSYSELSGMELLKKGSRLSVMPVQKNEFEFILKLITS